MKKLYRKSVLISRALLLGLVILTPASSFALGLGDALGLSPFWDWKTIETENFRITFPAELENTARKSAYYLEEAHLLLSPKLYWQPRSHVEVLVIDNTDLANGLTSAALRIGMVFMVTPPDPAFSTDYYDDWLRLLAIHEYTHFLNMDITTSWIEVLRIIFGDAIRPNSLWTNWMLEGLAVYMETRLTHGGRGRSPYYEMLLRTAVSEDVLGKPSFASIDRIGGNNPYFPAGETPYFFGYQLMNQVAKDPDQKSRTVTSDGRERLKSGEDALGIMSYRSSKRVPYFINSNLRNITGKTWHDYWDEWIRETQIRKAQELKTLRSQPLTPFEPLTEPAISVLGSAPSPDGEWIAYTLDSSDNRTSLFLKNLRTGKIKEIVEKIHGVGLSFSADSRYLFYGAPQRYRNYYLFSDLAVYDLKRNTTYSLSSGARYKDPDVSRDGKNLVFVSAAGQRNSLLTAALTYDDSGVPTLSEPKMLYLAKDYDRASNPKWSLDGKSVFFSLHQNGKIGANILSIPATGGEPRLIIADGANNRFPTISPSGALYYTSDKTGVDTIYRLGQSQSDKPALVVNTLTGAWLPSVSGLTPNETLYVSSFSAKGWSLVRTSAIAKGLDSKVLTLAKPPAPEPEEVPLELSQSATERSKSELKNYSLWPSILPRQWAPILSSDFKSAYVGGQILGFDALDRHQYVGYAAYDTSVKRLDWLAQYSNRSFGPSLTLGADYQTTSVGMLGSNVTHFTRKIRAYSSLSYPILWTYSNLTPRLGFQLEREFLFAPPDSERSASASRFVPSVDGTLTYSNVESSRLAVGPESGRVARVAARQYFDKDFGVWKGLVSDREYFRITDHSVLSPSVAASWVSRTSTYSDALVNIRGRAPQLLNTLEGTSEKSLDSLRIRGYPRKHILTRAAAVAALDFQFPLLRVFRGIGTNPIFFDNLYAVTFAETTFFPANNARRSFHLPSTGGGLRFSLDLLINLPMIFSLEYHQGFRSDFGGAGEIFFTAYLGGLSF